MRVRAHAYVNVAKVLCGRENIQVVVAVHGDLIRETRGQGAPLARVQEFLAFVNSEYAFV